ncbi:DUF421 domain-containing protein [Bacillus horti]|uniref:Uncharacterized membrane protein YcaP (DUF421 family) n=1 Tax=Caldalkalibacillus horti TaxID=77523 RepID=A0ABT9VX46_9BACI|nr:DUF421 domain-containing protein [Bacillus horti]MDQ0165561.1 uncharacterized membrane protein YcaP (DUF421 family) [Bacillus horti]
MGAIWYGAEDLPIYGFLVRALLVYVYMFLIIKILGQRSIGTLHPLDFLFGVIIGDILGEPLTSGDKPIAGPLAAAGLISFFHLSLSYLSLKTPRFRRIVEDEPLILIENGKILEKELRKTKITVESLMMDLRLRNAADLNEVDYAVLESNGQISVIKNTHSNALTPQDMQIKKPKKGYPSVLILDGHIISHNLKKFGNQGWLMQQLNNRGVKRVDEVFLMTVDHAGGVYISQKS